MRWIRNLELKNKLVLLAAVSAFMALLMACAGFMWHDSRMVRSAKLIELYTKAEMLANAGGCAVASERPDALRSLIAGITSDASVDAVCVFDVQGKIVASSGVSPERREAAKLPLNHNLMRFAQTGELEIFHPIVERGREIGVAYLKANMREVEEQVYVDAAVIAAVTICSLALALVFASMMQSLISKPILQLADAARKISSNDDLTIRVKTDSRDELRMLYDSFNTMVQQLESSQRELKEARDEMEARVDQRTQQLQNEIAQRETIQQELQRAKDAAEAANRAKSQFLANMSHEIRTPLNGILGFTDYMLAHDRQLSDQNRGEYLRTIKTCSENLMDLINDILDLSKIEAERMDFERIPFSPHSVIAEVISILRVKAREKNLKIDCRWESDIPETIQSDPVRVRQLLMNLVGNAIKFSEIGGVNVVARFDEPAEKLHISVIDTGIGIPSEAQHRLFNPFTQGDSTVTRRYGGTGLGLSICKRIVKGLGGDIHFTSKVGSGSTFSFWIDTGCVGRIVSSPDLLASNATQVPHVRGAISLASKRILVAEDGETNRTLVDLLLRETGAEVVLVENGLKAVDAAQSADFDLIILDMQMPVMDGYSAAIQLRASGYDKPIIALTAHAMRGDADRCIEAGCSGYLTKPIRHDLLLTRIFELTCDQDVKPAGANHSAGRASDDPLISQLPTDDPRFAGLVRDFIDRAREKVSELRHAHQSNNSEQMAKLAHWMKGSGGMAGFPIVTEHARELEHVVKKSDLTAIDSTLSSLETLIEQLQSPELGLA